MDQKKTVCYEEGTLPSWMMEQLAMGIMKSFFPVSFVKTDCQLTAVFQTEGYRPLSHIHEMSTEETLQLLCQLMMEMERNEKHYFFPEDYLLHSESVYYSPMKNRVKLIFLPNEEGLSAKEQLVQLTQFCISLIPEEGRGYLESWMEELKRDGFSYRSAIRRCELMQQEIYVCDIP